MIVVLIIGFVLYLIVGFFVIRQFSDIEATGEILAALMFLWPVLITGKIIKIILMKIGFYRPILGNIFTVLVSLAVLYLLVMYTKGLCVSIVNIGR